MNALELLQERAGVKADRKFGPNTFNAAMKLLELTPERAVHFFAQCAHESGHFTVFEENLNYSAGALQRVFFKYFKDEAQAKAYERQPEKIANRVYANRMGNGDELSGDGWKFRGRGAIQLTGTDNYKAFANHISDESILENPDKVKNEYGFESAMHFFTKNNIWVKCDEGFDEDTIRKVTRAINGGYNGLPERKQLTLKYQGYLV